MSHLLRTLRLPSGLRLCLIANQPSRTALTTGRSTVWQAQRSLSTTKSWTAEVATSSASTKNQSTPLKPPSSSTSESEQPSQFSDAPIQLQEDDPSHVDWTKSFHGLSTEPFSKEAAEVLLAPLNPLDVEIKPDGIIYLPEIKYRRILNKAFGPGGWGLAPRSETIVTDKAVTREYALLAHGR